MSSSFKLDVKPKEGLSYAIDRALDIEFGQDIQLKKSTQWQSIFDIISADQAEQTQKNQRQFTSGDNDVTNNKHYEVKEGAYFITQNAWNEIVKFVRQELNIAAPETQKISQPEAAKRSNEDHLREILQTANIQLNEEEFRDVLSKYETKLQLKANGMEITDESIESDLLAYINGKKYEKNEDLFYAQSKENILPDSTNDNAESFTIEGVKQAVEYSKQNPNNLQEAYRLNSEGYKQFGNSQLQIYDKSGDNLVDFNEFIDYEQQRVNKIYDEREIAAAKKVFDYIDVNDDGNINLKEMTLHGFAMSKITDNDTVRTGDSISYKDWWTTQTTLAGIGTDEEGHNYVKAQNRYQQLRELGEETIYNYEKHIK